MVSFMTVRHAGFSECWGSAEAGVVEVVGIVIDRLGHLHRAARRALLRVLLAITSVPTPLSPMMVCRTASAFGSSLHLATMPPTDRPDRPFAVQLRLAHCFVTDVEADALPAGPCENTGAPRTACVCTGPQQSDSLDPAAVQVGRQPPPATAWTNPPMRASATNGSRQTANRRTPFRLSPTMKQ